MTSMAGGLRERIEPRPLPRRAVGTLFAYVATFLNGTATFSFTSSARTSSEGSPSSAFSSPVPFPFPFPLPFAFFFASSSSLLTISTSPLFVSRAILRSARCMRFRCSGCAGYGVIALNANGKIALSEHAEYADASLASLSGSLEGNTGSDDGTTVGPSEGSRARAMGARSGDIASGAGAGARCSARSRSASRRRNFVNASGRFQRSMCAFVSGCRRSGSRSGSGKTASPPSSVGTTCASRTRAPAFPCARKTVGMLPLPLRAGTGRVFAVMWMETSGW